jgi:hypothetical protein
MPPAALHLIKKVLYVYVLEILLEEPYKGFFNLSKEQLKG